MTALAVVERPLAALASLLGRTAFRSEANRMGKLSTETWVVPRYSSQYTSKKDGYAVSRVVERAVANAEASGAAVLTLGLLNQIECAMQTVGARRSSATNKSKPEDELQKPDQVTSRVGAPPRHVRLQHRVGNQLQPPAQPTAPPPPIPSSPDLAPISSHHNPSAQEPSQQLTHELYISWK